jgi:hypothetical protein
LGPGEDSNCIFLMVCAFCWAWQVAWFFISGAESASMNSALRVTYVGLKGVNGVLFPVGKKGNSYAGKVPMCDIMYLV